MIIRQTCSRHGRTTIQATRQYLSSRQYATQSTWSETPTTLAAIDKQIDDLEGNQKNLKMQIYSRISERLTSAMDQANSPVVANNVPSPPAEQFTNKYEFDEIQSHLKKRAKFGSLIRSGYDPSLAFKHPPTASQLTLPMLMAAQTHLGHATALWNPRNSSYIFGIRDGVHIISLDVTYAYLRRAAKVVQEVARKGGMILFVGTRDNQDAIIVKVAQMAGGYHIFDRWVPGSLTNGQQILGHCRLNVVDVKDNDLPDYSDLLTSGPGHPVLKPDLVVCLNPLENEVCLHECGLHTVPTIGVIDTDADASCVTYPIPANDDSVRSITLIAGVLGHAGAQGKRERMEAADLGKATYDTGKVKDTLRQMEKMARIKVGARGGGSRDD